MPLVLLNAASALAAEDLTKASGRIEGRNVKFPAKSLEEGAEATIILPESCHDASDDSIQYTEADLKNALEGNHIRLVFAKPQKVKVLNEKLEITELIFALPTGRGVFWLRSVSEKKETILRATKFEFSKQKLFEEWMRQARAE